MRNDSLAPYQAYLVELAKSFTHITYPYLPHKENQFIDAQEELATMINIPRGIYSMPLVMERRDKPS